MIYQNPSHNRGEELTAGFTTSVISTGEAPTPIQAAVLGRLGSKPQG